jgi:predicted metal-binding membrane protein
MIVERWKRSEWRHPEWWALALSMGAWGVLLADGVHRRMAAWSFMVVAMMVPLLVGPIRTTAARSLWHRRHRAIAIFLAGYLTLWIAAGVGVALLSSLLGLNGGSPHALVVASSFALAAGWQLAPAKRRALNACHRTMPLAPRGGRADRDCFRYGARIGVYCLASCWALMLACMLTGHTTEVLVGVALVLAEERYLRLTGRGLLPFRAVLLAHLRAGFRGELARPEPVFQPGVPVE